VRLIRSKGRPVCFSYPEPGDHTAGGFCWPAWQQGAARPACLHSARTKKAIKAAADTFRNQPRSSMSSKPSPNCALVKLWSPPWLEDGATLDCPRTSDQAPREVRPWSRFSAKDARIINSISPMKTNMMKRSPAQRRRRYYAQKVIDDQRATAGKSEERVKEEVRQNQPRKSKSIWEKAFSRGWAKVAGRSAAGMAASTMLGKKSRANPVAVRCDFCCRFGPSPISRNANCPDALSAI